MPSLMSCKGNKSIAINDSLKVKEIIISDHPTPGAYPINAFVYLKNIYSFTMSSFYEEDIISFRIMDVYFESSREHFVDIDFNYSFNDKTINVEVDKDYISAGTSLSYNNYCVQLKLKNSRYQFRVIESDKDYIVKRPYK